MELRHLRYFIAVAEELHYSRAAERLHIEPSPLSRAIKDLEGELGITLLKRDRRGTHLTPAGNVFLEEARRLFMMLEHAKASAKSAASGYRSTLRIALSDNVAQPRLAAILARCREEEPDVEVRLIEVPFSEQLRGLQDDTFDAGFSRSMGEGDSLLAQPVWTDSLVIVMPQRHPLLIHKEVPLGELLKFPLIMADSKICPGCNIQVKQILRKASFEPQIAEYVTSESMMLTLVAAGYGLGFSTDVSTNKPPDIVMRPLGIKEPLVTTYLLTSKKPHLLLASFIERVKDVSEGASMLKS